MQSTHQNQPHKRTAQKRKQHGRVIDLRRLVSHHAAREASALVKETEQYVRHANRVLRRAFAEWVYAPTRQQDTELPRVRSTNEGLSRAQKFGRRLVSLRWTRKTVFWHTVYSTAAFAVVACLIVVPVSVSALVRNALHLKETVSGKTVTGVDALVRAAQLLQSLDFATAGSEFARAQEVFSSTSAQLHADGSAVLAVARALPFTSATVSSGEDALIVGKELSAAGEDLTTVLDDISRIATLQDPQSLQIVPILQALHTAIETSRAHVQKAALHMSRISDSAVPAEYADVFDRMKTALPMMNEQMGSVQALIETMLAIAGTTEEKSYILLFQNNREMRPTGGFIGSVAIVYVKNGVIESIDVPPGGVYDIAGQLDQKIAAPEPLQLVTPYWNIQDANWFPHFPVSAEKVMWFYEQITNSAVDGVFTFTPDVLESLLTITGPIDLTTAYGVVITADNVYDELQKRAEEKYDVTQESKKIIGDLSQKLVEQLSQHMSTPTDLVRIAQVLKDALTQKHLLAYMTDAVTESNLSAFDWAGELKSTDRDYLSVVYANIRGGKTDQNIDRTVTHSAQIETNGTVTDTVNLHFAHAANPQSDYENFTNIEYVRFYVPEGAVLLSASGFTQPDESLFLRPDPSIPEDTDLAAIQGAVSVDPLTQVYTNTEFGKTVFGGWIQTPIGAESTVTLKYTLPFTIDAASIDHYSLLVQKQAGNFPEKDTLKTYIHIPDSWQKKYETSTLYGDGQRIPLYTDQLFGIVFAQQ